VNRYTIFTDIAGRVAQDTSGSDRVTAAAVAVDTQCVAALRGVQAPNFPKWRDCALKDAEAVVELLIREAAAVSAVTVYKNTDAWRKFWSDAEPLQGAIVAEDRRVAGFVKPANVVTYWLFGHAFALATAHAVKLGPKTRIVDYRGREAIERTIVCDDDVKGEENIEVFTSLWERHDGSQPRMEQLGLRFYTRDVVVTTEQEEPLLLYADYLAGIVHTAFITDRGRIPLPLSMDDAKHLLDRLRGSGKLTFHATEFDLVYGDVFGEAHRRSIESAC
jgi:hypothetical protein